MYRLAKQDIQHRPTGCPLRLTVVAAPLQLLIFSNDKCRTVMRRIPVFFLHSRDKIQGFLLGLYRAHGRNKAGLLLNNLVFATFKYDFNLFHILFSFLRFTICSHVQNRFGFL